MNFEKVDVSVIKKTIMTGWDHWKEWPFCKTHVMISYKMLNKMYEKDRLNNKLIEKQSNEQSSLKRELNELKGRHSILVDDESTSQLIIENQSKEIEILKSTLKGLRRGSIEDVEIINGIENVQDSSGIDELEII